MSDIQVHYAVANHLNNTATRFLNKLGAIIDDLGDILRYVSVGVLLAGHLHHIIDYTLYRQYRGFEPLSWRIYREGEFTDTQPSYDKATVDGVVGAVIKRHRNVLLLFVGSAAGYAAGYLMNRLGRHLRDRKVRIWS